MTIGPHVFGDGRLGIWNINPRNLADRAHKLKAFGFTDIFLPRDYTIDGARFTTTADDLTTVRDAELGAHLWVAPHGRAAGTFARDTLQDIVRLSPGAVELNVELANDDELEGYMTTALAIIRKAMPNRRIRLNIAWRKAPFLPVELLVSDANLYVAEQNYVDPPGASMSPTSAADAMLDLVDAGVPIAKAAVCYGAAGPVGGNTGLERVCTLPHGGGWLPRRGVVFSDDLLVDAGFLA